jgi:dipeptidyl aminopeptidase/acylaminoacyl peptidase
MRRAIITVIVLFLVVPFAFAQEEYITPGDNLVLDGIPKIPVALADQIGRYNDFRAAYFFDWHPVEQQMIIATRFADAYQAHIVRSPGGARTQLTFYKDGVVGAMFDRKNGDFFVFDKDIGGNENYQKYRFDFSTGKTSLLTDGKSRNTGGAWSNSGELCAYHSTRRTGKDVDLYVVNPADPKTDRLLTQLEGGGWDALDWSPDDSKILLSEFISINESYLWIADAKTGEKKLITLKGEKEKIAYQGGAFSKDGKGIYVTTDKNSEFRQLAHIDLSTLEHTYLTEEIPWDVDDFVLSYDRSKVAFVANENGASILHATDLLSGKEITLPHLPLGIIWGIKWHKNGKDIGFTFISARSGADAYSINIDTGVMERWTFSETGGLNTDNFSEPELVKWTTFDGKTISGFLYRPSSTFTGKRPVIVDIHGGPESQERAGFRGRYNFFLNEMGIAILYPNVRGSSGYGKTFLKLDNGYLREDSYKDIGSLLDWINTRPDLDGDRIMVTGGSYGGHMTLAVATRYSDKIRCAVADAAMSNLVTFLENTSGYRQDLRRVEYGDERNPKMREFLLKIAPLNMVGNVRKPLFIIQGANDPRVPASEAMQMVTTLKKIGTPVWYLLAKDEGHGFAKKKNQDFQFDATVLFIKEFLLN